MPRLLPRILFITNEPPLTVGAGSIILHRLFQDYPPDRLCVVTNRELGTAEQRLPCTYVQLKLPADRLNRTRFWRWRANLRALGASRATRLSRVDHATAGFEPDIVVGLMQDSWFYDLARRYAAGRKLPFVLFVHDVPAGFEPVPAWLRVRQRLGDARVYRQARRRLCVSPGMVEHFAAEFGVRGEVLLPPRSLAPVAQEPGGCARLKTPGRLTLGYAGGLHYGYGEQLLQIVPTLRATGTVVEMFGPPPAGAVESLHHATDVFTFNGYVSPPETAWRVLLERCDVVLQPYLNPPGPHEHQYRTHFPSKLGDCLSLGLPLLITGPSYASGVKWCLEHPGSAEVVTDPSPRALASALERLRDDEAFRIGLATSAQKVAPEFDADRLRTQLHEILRREAEVGS